MTRYTFTVTVGTYDDRDRVAERIAAELHRSLMYRFADLTVSLVEQPADA